MDTCFHPLFASLLERDWLVQLSQTSRKPVYIKGLYGSSLATTLHAQFLQTATPGLIIAQDKEEAAYILNDLETLAGTDQVVFFPESYRRAYDQEEETDNGNVLLRTEALNAIRSGKFAHVVTYPAALAEKVITKKGIEQKMQRLVPGDPLDPDFVFDLLLSFDFEREDFVYEPGQFAMRGGIIDVFSYAHDQPLRLEFSKNAIAEIRTFNPENQLSTGNIKEAFIIPNIENKQTEELRLPLPAFMEGKPHVWVFDVRQAEEDIQRRFTQIEELYASKNFTIAQAPPEQKYLDGFAFRSCLQDLPLFIYKSAVTEGEMVDAAFQPAPVIARNYPHLLERLLYFKSQEIQTLILCSKPNQLERLQQILTDLLAQQKSTLTPEDLFTPAFSVLQQGFWDVTGRKVIFTDHEIFDRHRRYQLKNRFSANQAVTLKELTDLQPGDFVTHIDHGVGQFAGLEKTQVNGKAQEAVKIVFKDGDAIFVSIHALHRIARFSGKDGKAPTLSKLGSPAWQNLKAKTRQKVRTLAFDLLSLYARRKTEKGFAFSGDNPWMHELEASFPWEETPDQAKAISDIKADMERPIPMDRLVCGDVGFGKTEVAIRAAFKAVCDHKQVAILVPTTILAFQHFKTFSNRLKHMPCRVAYINRFRSAKQQKDTLEDVANGKIDILIGTHKLLSGQIQFKDLGLLIIDEEQKFGVSAKDKLKTLKVHVDTLTLTATPIPRTLQFSLMGARDLSVIRTPPANRQPVITELKGLNEAFIRDAILYEINRNGQVFFLHNRVQNLPEITGMIQRLVPDARVRSAHGQMDGKQLEQVMLDFIDGDFDVLVSTSIVENGLDVPNANTIIINQAQNFGLSDLHQMRGRVGRGNRKAFCYLVTPPFYTLSSESRRRLQALIEFSDLGSGFNIAMKDLDIRGGGDLLGADQSGFIQEMGLETYQRILSDAVRELKEKEFQDVFREELSRADHQWVDDCHIDTDLDIMLPEQYVDQIAERLALYKELDHLEKEEELVSFVKRLEDRFGPLPPPAAALIDTIRLRNLGRTLGFEKISLKNQQMSLHFPSKPDAPFFESNLFQWILQKVASWPNAELKQKQTKLSLLIKGIPHVHSAYQKLQQLQPQESTIQETAQVP